MVRRSGDDGLMQTRVCKIYGHCQSRIGMLLSTPTLPWHRYCCKPGQTPSAMTAASKFPSKSSAPDSCWTAQPSCLMQRSSYCSLIFSLEKPSTGCGQMILFLHLSSAHCGFCAGNEALSRSVLSAFFSWSSWSYWVHAWCKASSQSSSISLCDCSACLRWSFNFWYSFMTITKSSLHVLHLSGHSLAIRSRLNMIKRI